MQRLGQLRPTTDFWKRKRSVDGLSLYCKDCFSRRNFDAKERRRAALGQAPRPYKPRVQVPPGSRRCPDCSAVKPLEEFPSNKSGRLGRGRYCKPCHNIRGRENRIKNHGSTREYHLKRRYGIGQKDVDEMLSWQGNVCAACGKPDPEHVDHDHVTGEVRGMLCFNCNQALGNVRDDPTILLALHDYLLLGRRLPRQQALELGAIQRREAVHLHFHDLPVELDGYVHARP